MTASIQQIDLERILNTKRFSYVINMSLACFLNLNWSLQKSESFQSRTDKKTSKTIKQQFKTKTDLEYSSAT